MRLELERLSETVTMPRTDPIYNCHAYLTKVPIGAILPFIETFTDPGDLVVDFFAGSGMTGLAALTLGRDAKLSDISVLGQHIAKGYLTNVPSADLTEAAGLVCSKARKALGDLYLTERETDGSWKEMVRTVWSFVYVCPACTAPMVYFDHLDEKGKPPSSCPTCEGPFARRSWKRLDDVPVEVVVTGENGKQRTQAVQECDLASLHRAERDRRLQKVPSQTIEEIREMYSRSGLGKAGLTETRRFFSPRNAIALYELWKAINELKDEDLRQKLRFAFTAILARASKRYQWSRKRPLNAQNQTYYIAPVYYEWNVFELFARKVTAAIKAAEMLFRDDSLLDDGRKSTVSYELASGDDLRHLKSGSVDYVFTDPPFGSNIFYSDMSLFHEAWIGQTTNHDREAVVHTTGKRKNGAEERYADLLRRSFEEGWRILKPGKYMSVVFGNSSGRIWGLVQRALRDAGFKAAPVHVAILDKGQRSVKGLNSGSEGVATVDLILTVQKPGKSESKDNAIHLENGDKEELIAEAVRELSLGDSWSPSHVYAQVLRKAIRKYMVLDDLHLGDVLIALRNAGFEVDSRTGLIRRSEQPQKHVASA